ncbi:hypothetical protein [Chitinophaga pinensis]|uniref:SGNH domain-containing protein n=1 Tax=Chitinophaga pinensis TaxID=79329 RepID=A0A5C6LLW4_9BACT|nr:hypothetical protein [Chitinophaga pinensis]TWV93009.1 hypothetical protein FEF09_27745 [Chitinophaga pinensis]
MCKNIKERLSKADVIFFTEIRVDTLRALTQRYGIDTTKVWIVGNKNFGANNGIFYRKRGDNNYCTQRVNIRQQALKINNELKAQWGSRYIDLIGMVIDEQGRMPVFTDSCMFISQDTRHLTRAGAIYFARLIDHDKSFTLLNRPSGGPTASVVY